MMQNINEFLGGVAQTHLGKAARRSAGTILNAHREAFLTTRREAGKVFELAIKEGQKLRTRARGRADGVVENLAGAADDQLSAFEHVLQKRVGRAIERIGLPTAKDVNALSRRVEALARKVERRSRVTRKSARKAAHKPAVELTA